MMIQWKQGGGVQLVELTAQEWGWLKRELSRVQPPVIRDGGDAFIEQFRHAVPINAADGSKGPDLSSSVL